MLNLDPIWTPEFQQQHFRLLLDAMARPGKCQTLINVPDNGPCALAVLATLLDAEVSLADPHALLDSADWPMLQAKSTNAETADFVLCDGTRTPDFTPKLGSLHSPELSATLILMVEELGQGNTHLQLSGPGIAGSQTLMIKGLDSQWLVLREDWVCAFPMGVDLILVAGKQVAALPRTSKVEVR
ncbi:MAG: phosphonate C-P lyase system protein PhnH [Gammaproteobacteria bacterium]